MQNLCQVSNCTNPLKYPHRRYPYITVKAHSLTKRKCQLQCFLTTSVAQHVTRQFICAQGESYSSDLQSNMSTVSMHQFASTRQSKQQEKHREQFEQIDTAAEASRDSSLMNRSQPQLSRSSRDDGNLLRFTFGGFR
jgi:hypothetical protein